MSQHFQDFKVIDVGHKTRHPVQSHQTSSRKTHEQSVHSRLEHTEMGDESFEQSHKKIEQKNAQFRTKLIQARNKLKMTQPQFANMLNVNKNIIQEIESGKRKPDPSFIQRITNKLAQVTE